VKIMATQIIETAAVSAEQLAHIGEGAIAYVRPIKAEEAQALFPQVEGLKPGMRSSRCSQPMACLLCSPTAPLRRSPTPGNTSWPPSACIEGGEARTKRGVGRRYIEIDAGHCTGRISYRRVTVAGSATNDGANQAAQTRDSGKITVSFAGRVRRGCRHRFARIFLNNFLERFDAIRAT
jgi:hypothetical protein